MTAASARPGGEATPGGLVRATLLTWACYLALFLPGAVAGGALGVLACLAAGEDGRLLVPLGR